MIAKPCSAEYSSFSVLCSSVYKVTPLSVIKGSSFYPAPRVDSQGVLMDLIPDLEERSRLFYPLVRALFSSRRKIIRNTLSSFITSVIIKQKDPKQKTIPLELAADVFNRTGISGERRPETLTIDEFAALAATLEEALSNE
jgi:16S rRNA (adenine1518-N6/adenine1519-N6)-dimethyltransferase